MTHPLPTSEQTSELVERVARALYECDGGSAEDFASEATMRPSYYALARAALSSLPTSNSLVREALSEAREAIPVLRNTLKHAVGEGRGTKRCDELLAIIDKALSSGKGMAD